MDNGLAAPIGEDELAGLFSNLARFCHVLLAVSGGPDSMALMHLVARWRDRTMQTGQVPPVIEVATVDHGLRPQSADEARAVATAAASLGLAHATLVWAGEKPATHVQEAARHARYSLLAHRLRDTGHAPAALVTAHTADDQAETFLMRLARGSGLDGLSAMANERPSPVDPAFTLLRPLLGVSKERLMATLRAADVPWFEDPSNESADFERVRIRRARSMLADIGLANDRLALSARRLGRARLAIEASSEALFARAVALNDGLFASIDFGAIADEPDELKLRVLTRALAAFGGAARPARLIQIEALLADIERGTSAGQTLGGCLVAVKGRLIRISREPGRTRPAELILHPGEKAIWDCRFEVALAQAETGAGAKFEALTVRALGDRAYATLCAGLSDRPCPAHAGAMLPSFWSGDSLVAVPPLAHRVAAAAGPVAGGHALCTAVFVGHRTEAGSGRVSGEEML